MCGGFYIVNLLKAHTPPLQPSPKSWLMIGFSVASAPANKTQLCTLDSGTERKGSVHSGGSAALQAHLLLTCRSISHPHDGHSWLSHSMCTDTKPLRSIWFTCPVSVPVKSDDEEPPVLLFPSLFWSVAGSGS